MRVGCGSATVGIFAKQWFGEVDEVIVVDDHITGVLTEHQAGRVLDMRPAGIRVRGRKSTPGRYFQVANPGLGWGGTDITDPLAIIQKIDPETAWPGLRLLLTSTTGEDALYCVLDEKLRPVPAEMPASVREVVERIGENCEPSVSTVMFMAGAGGSLRAGVTNNPVRLTRSVAAGETRVTMGGAPVYVWPGGGITVMVDVTRMPKGSFGYVPTPAIVAPMEFTLPRDLYEGLGGHAGDIVSVAEMLAAVAAEARVDPWRGDNPWPFAAESEVSRRAPYPLEEVEVREPEFAPQRSSPSLSRDVDLSHRRVGGRGSPPIAGRPGRLHPPPRASARHRHLQRGDGKILDHADAVRGVGKTARSRQCVAERARPPDRHGPGDDFWRGEPPDQARLRRRSRWTRTTRGS